MLPTIGMVVENDYHMQVQWEPAHHLLQVVLNKLFRLYLFFRRQFLLQQYCQPFQQHDYMVSPEKLHSHLNLPSMLNNKSWNTIYKIEINIVFTRLIFSVWWMDVEMNCFSLIFWLHPECASKLVSLVLFKNFNFSIFLPFDYILIKSVISPFSNWHLHQQ